MVTPTTPENARAMTIQQTTKDPLPQQTQIVSTVILQQQPAASPPQAITINFNIPPWLMFSGLLLLTAVVIILALLVVTATRQKR
jgi:protein-S-isoprenylcysteine O-methyltransferase Ste14